MAEAISCVIRGTGAPLLLVHGFALDHRMWHYQLDALSEEYRVIAVDVPGCGESPSLGARTMGELASQIFDSVQPLLEGQPVTYMGLSMGGYIGWEMLARFPEAFRGAVFCDTRAAADLPTTAEGRKVMARKVLEEGVEAVLAPMIPRLLGDVSLVENLPVVELMKSMMFATPPQTVHDHQMAMSERQDFQARLAEFQLPILLICGNEDILTPPKEMRRMAQALPQASFVEIDHAGHMAPLEQPEAVNKHILEFLRSIHKKESD